MNNLFVLGISAIMLLMPSFVGSQTEKMTAGVPPPIEQPLVREGDFAIKLVEILKIGAAQNEAEAEAILSSYGIAPKNGWITDYPVTPDIVGELQNAIMDAVEGGRLPMERDEAFKAFQDLVAALHLPIVADTSGSGTGRGPGNDYERYYDQTVVNHHYYSYGPPIITYYPPPWDYYYLYSWVPSPFWIHGFFFHGFYVLNHFHRPIFIHKRAVVISNRVFDPVNKKVFIVDPVKRSAGKTARVEINRTRSLRSDSGDARRGAASIFERSRDRTSGRGGDMNVPPSALRSRGDGPVRETTSERSLRSGMPGRDERSSKGRVFSRQRDAFPRNETNFERPSSSGERFSSGQGRRREVERSIRPPSSSSRGFSGSGPSDRAFTPPSRGGREFFSAPSTGSRGSPGEFRSGSSNGGGSRGMGLDGSSRNWGSGGCRGRC